MQQFLTENIFSIISTLFGGGSLLAFVFERKKNKAITKQESSKADQEEATAISNMRNAYKAFTEDMNERHNEVRKELEDVKNVLSKVRNELKEYKQTCDTCEIRLKNQQKRKG